MHDLKKLPTQKGNNPQPKLRYETTHSKMIEYPYFFK